MSRGKLFGFAALALLLSAGVAPEYASAQQAAETGRPYLRHFSPKAYNAAPQNWTIVQDGRGLLYVGNNVGLLEYDGDSWRRLALANYSMVRSLAAGADGRVYVGGVQDLGYLAPDSLGQMRFVSLRDHVPEADLGFQDVWSTSVTSDGVYFLTDATLMRWDGEAMRTWRPTEAFYLSFAVDDAVYVHEPGVGLLTVEDDSLVQVPGGARFADARVYFMLPLGGGEILIGTRTQGLFRYDGRSFHPFRTEADGYFLENQLYHGTVLPDGTIALGTIRGGAVLIDADGRLVRILDRAMGLQDNVVNYTYVDREGGLWLAHDDGLSRAEVDAPLHLFAERTGLRGDVQAVERHQGTLYAATMLGVYRLEPGTGGRLSTFVPLPAIASMTLGLLSAGPTLLVATNDGVYAVEGGRTDRLSDQPSLTLHRSRQDTNVVFVGLADGLLRLRYDTRRRAWREAEPVEGVAGEIHTIAETEPGELWLGLQPDGLLRARFTEGPLAPPAVAAFDDANDLPPGQIRVFDVAGETRFSTFSGLYRFLPADTLFAPDTTFGAAYADGSRYVFLLVEDPGGDVWMELDGEIVAARRQADGTFRPEQVTALRRIPSTTVNALYLEQRRGRPFVWIGSTDGLIQFDATRPKDFVVPYPALIRRASASDSLLFGGAAFADYARPSLRFADNTLLFSFAAPSFEDDERTVYRYQLEGFDEGWSAWAEKREKEYTNLLEGDYVFRVQARNIYGGESQEGRYAFTVLPPWYRTWWAYGLYLLLAVGVIYVSVRAWTWRLEQQNRRLEAVVQKRTREVRKQNVEIRKQSEEIRHKNEENERLLLNILPVSIANRLKQGEETIADDHPEVTVLFTDIVGFTGLASRITAPELVHLLNKLFYAFDNLSLQHGVEKIKTIGDAYMAVAGLPEYRPDHAEVAAAMALDMLDTLDRFNGEHGTELKLRIGVNTGPVVAGVIGLHKFVYDLWGDAVNVASRMESHGIPNQVHVSASTYERLKDRYVFEPRGEIDVKGKGRMATYLLGRTADHEGRLLGRIVRGEVAPSDGLVPDEVPAGPIEPAGDGDHAAHAPRPT